MERHTSRALASPTISNDDSLSNIFQSSLSITDSRSSLTPDQLLREADLCLRDAALRVREAAMLREEAELIRRAANLRRREEEQDAAELLVPSHGDTSAFWDSLQDEPSSEDESDLTISIPSSPTAVTLPTLQRTHQGTSSAHRSPPMTPEPLGDARVYEVTSPGKQGITATWATAGHHTLPNIGAHAKLISTPTRARHARFKYFTIIKGTSPGVYKGRWYDYIHLVKHVPHANYKGYQTRAEATAAYVIAYALGFVEAIPARGPSALPIPPTASIVTTTPTQNEILAALATIPPNVVGQSWYAVFKGIKPGVYPSWNFVSDLVIGVSTSTYHCFESSDAAQAAFTHAQCNGEVAELRGDHSYVIPAR